jgi:hypothetical protein
MRPRILAGVVSTGMLLTFSFPAVSPGRPPTATREVTDAVPFFCFTQPWDSEFKIVSTRLDVEKRQIIWVIEAKKDAKVSSYEAEINDGDNVNLVTVNLKTDPGPGEVKTGAKIRVIASLSEVLYLDEICKLNIRQRK